MLVSEVNMFREIAVYKKDNTCIYLSSFFFDLTVRNSHTFYPNMLKADHAKIHQWIITAYKKVFVCVCLFFVFVF